MQRLFLPSPGGKYQVGYTKFRLVNAGVKDSQNENKNRTCDIFAWYPCNDSDNKIPNSYFTERSRDSLSLLSTTIGEDLLKKFTVANGVSASGTSEISDRRETFPVIIFSRDLGYLPEYYVALMEHLASTGFIVFSIDHAPLPGEQNFYTGLFRERLAFIAQLKFKQRILSTLSLITSRRNTEEKDYRKLLGPLFDEVIKDRQSDALFLLNYLEGISESLRKLDVNQFFCSRLDLRHTILIGHGFGSSSLQPLLSDQRISSLVCLGNSFLKMNNAFFPKPTLVLTTKKNWENVESPFFNQKYNEILLEEMSHRSFSDLIFYDHLKNAFDLDELPLSPRVTFNRITQAIDSFVDRYSRGRTSVYVNRQIL